MSEDKICFVIAPIGDPDSETRKRSDQVLKHVIRPAVKSCGYKAARADEIDKPGLITSQVIQHVVSDDLVVADLTERNPNVFYELAIRHAIRKPLVQIIKKGDSIPFDVAGTRTIYVDHRDLDSVEAAKTEITDQIKALEKDSGDIETPISVSLDLQFLRQSEKPEERSLADIMGAMADLRANQSKLETMIGSGQSMTLEALKSDFKTLPSRIEEYLEYSRGPAIRRSRLHPGMLQEMLHFPPFQEAGLGILIVASFFRDSMPWIYDLSLELYRDSKRGSATEFRKTAKELRRAIEFAVRSPMSREFFGRNKDTYMILEEIEPVLARSLDQLESERRHSQVIRRTVLKKAKGAESE